MKTSISRELSPDLRREWEALWRANPHLATAFNSPVWLCAAKVAFKPKDVRIITIREEDNTLVGVCALTGDTVYGLRVFTSPVRQFADKPSILLDWTNVQAVKALTIAFKSIGTIYLSYCREEIAKALQKAAPTVVFQDDENAIVEFKDGYRGDLSRDSYNKILKRIKKSKEPVTMRFSKSSHDALLKDVYAVEKISTKGERGMAEFNSLAVRTFFEALAIDQPELVRISILDIGARPVAYSIDLLAHGIYQGSQKAYVKGYEYYQPGKYMVLKLLEHNYTEGYQAFDFGRGYDNFKIQFTKTVRPVYSVVAGNQAAGLYLKNARAARQKIYESVVRNKALYKTFKGVKQVLKQQP
jgi:CelD/BcsL family acetyltransferase involved in cellulose biosynthesis